MYQYKAILQKSNKVIAEAHSVEDVEKLIVRFKREQKRNLHTRGNEKINIFHVTRKTAEGQNQTKETLIKVV